MQLTENASCQLDLPLQQVWESFWADAAQYSYLDFWNEVIDGSQDFVKSKWSSQLPSKIALSRTGDDWT